MKILFCGYRNPRFAFIADYIEKAFRQNGHDVRFLDWHKTTVPGRIRRRVPFLEAWDRNRLNKKLVDAAKKCGPELVLIEGGDRILPQTISIIKKIAKPVTIRWVSDYPRGFERYMSEGPYYDLFLSSSTQAVQRYREGGNKNGFWMPFACDPEVHKPVKLSQEEKKRYRNDICFVGSNYAERVEILEALAEFDIGIWGIGWDKLKEGSDLSRKIRGGPVTPEVWTKIYSASKISLNLITNFHHLNPKKKELGFANMRAFEILSCGGFQLLDNKKDVARMFKSGKHLVTFNSIDDLKSKIEYYLKHKEERKQIAEKGRRFVVENHTYNNRIEQIISIITSQKSILRKS